MKKSDKALRTNETNAIFAELTEQEQELLRRIIKAERNKLHMSKPKGINDDIEKAITEVIK